MEESKDKIKIRDLRNGEWFWVNRLVLDHPYFTASTKLIYHALAYFANNKTQEAYPSIKRIKELTGLGSRTTIVGAIKELEKYHFIRVKRKKGKTSEYILLKLIDSKPVQKLDYLKKYPKWTG